MCSPVLAILLVSKHLRGCDAFSATFHFSLLCKRRPVTENFLKFDFPVPLAENGETNPAPIEIEARFGVQTQTFESGVTSAQEFLNLKRMCLRRFALQGKKETTDIIWSNSEKASSAVAQITNGKGGNVRLSYRDGVPVSCEVKYRIKDGSVGWPTKYTYATRFSASSEQPAPIPSFIEGTDQVTVRRKRRTTYAPTKSFCIPSITLRNCMDPPPPVLGDAHPLADLAVIDLTEVYSKESTVAMAVASMEDKSNETWTKLTYEVEIELKQEALARAGFGASSFVSVFMPVSGMANKACSCCSTVESLKALADTLYDFILEMQDMIAEARRDTFCDTFLQKVTDPGVTALLRARLNTCCHTDPAGTEFPGCMPINFSRKHFETVRWEEYLVSEKTDGNRFLMLFLKNTNPGGSGGAIYVTDRSFVFHRVAGSLAKELAAAVTTEGDTLVDGELVRNLEWQDPVFLLFDVLEWNGTNQLESIYSQRISLIGNLVGTHDEIARKPKPHPIDVLPFRIAGKSIKPKKDIDQVFGFIRPGTSHGERIYREKGREFKRCHFSDGIILCPDAPYQLKTQTNLFKWKYTDKETIDFHVEFAFPTDPSRGEVRLFCQGDREEILIKTITLDPAQNIKLQQDIRMARLGADQPAIAEFGYDPIVGQWQYHLLRKDKLKANHIRIVIDTMESIAENISAAELQFRLLEENDDEIAKVSAKQDAAWTERLGRAIHQKRQQHQSQRQAAQFAQDANSGPQYDATAHGGAVNYSDGTADGNYAQE